MSSPAQYSSTGCNCVSFLDSLLVHSCLAYLLPELLTSLAELSTDQDGKVTYLFAHMQPTSFFSFIMGISSIIQVQNILGC